MSESAGSNNAAQKTSHKCCAAALCTNRSDNRKDLTFHAFPKDSQRRMEWAVKMKRSDSKFKSNTSLFCCSEHFVSTYRIQAQFNWEKERSFANCYSFAVSVDQSDKS